MLHPYFKSLMGVVNKSIAILYIITVNSLWLSDSIWQHRIGSTLAQVMACCLLAPSHYLNQCWFVIIKFPWHSFVGIVIRSDDNNWSDKLDYKIASRSLWDQWVNQNSSHHYKYPWLIARLHLTPLLMHCGSLALSNQYEMFKTSQ